MAKHSTAQHSTAQHSTAQHEAGCVCTVTEYVLQFVCRGARCTGAEERCQEGGRTCQP